ncbi:MAG: hypothetical protein ACRDL4_09120, partial [Thermoleophilaceae bacterium]
MIRARTRVAFTSLPARSAGRRGSTRRRRTPVAPGQRSREAVDVPLFLAGGLRPENAREAIETVHPFGLDVCSGLRSGDDFALDPDRLER